MTSAASMFGSIERLTDEQLRELIEGIGIVVPEEDEERDWLIPGYLHAGVTAITGQPERGKTTLLISMCKGLLAGQWLGLDTDFDVKTRIAFGCEDVLAVGRIRKAARGDARVVPFQLTGWTPQDLGRRLRSADCGLLVVDSLTAVVSDINDQSEAIGFVNSVRGLGVPVAVVHHSAVNGQGPSGAQPYKAAYRHTIQASKIETGGDDIIVTIKRSGNDIATTTDRLRINRVTHAAEVAENKRPRTVQAVAKPVTAIDKVRALRTLVDGLGIDPNLGHNEIANALLGGARGNEDVQSVTVVANALESRTIGHRTVSDLIKKNRGTFLDRTDHAA
jgi:hypothetical protein